LACLASASNGIARYPQPAMLAARLAAACGWSAAGQHLVDLSSKRRRLHQSGFLMAAYQVADGGTVDSLRALPENEPGQNAQPDEDAAGSMTYMFGWRELRLFALARAGGAAEVAGEIEHARQYPRSQRSVQFIAWVCGRLDDSDTLELLAEMASGEDIPAMAAALSALARRREPRAEKIILESAERILSTDHAIDGGLACQLAEALSAHPSEQAAGYLISLLIRDSSSSDQQSGYCVSSAIQGLADRRMPLTAALWELATQGDRATRGAALSALAARRDSGIDQQLRKIFSVESDPARQLELACALASNLVPGDLREPVRRIIAAQRSGDLTRLDEGHVSETTETTNPGSVTVTALARVIPTPGTDRLWSLQGACRDPEIADFVLSEVLLSWGTGAERDMPVGMRVERLRYCLPALEPRIAKGIETLVANPSAPNRTRAEAMIALVASTAGYSLDPAVSSAAENALATAFADTDPYVRACACFADTVVQLHTLAKKNGAVNKLALSRCLDDSDPTVRIYALSNCLWQTADGSPQLNDLQPFIDRIGDANATVRRTALMAIAHLLPRLRDTTAVERKPLIDALEAARTVTTNDRAEQELITAVRSRLNGSRSKTLFNSVFGTSSHRSSSAGPGLRDEKADENHQFLHVDIGGSAAIFSELVGNVDGLSLCPPPFLENEFAMPFGIQ
jgi:hypothetical protein